MSLFSSIHLAKQALFASQVGIQVAGNNIANADTPGFIRERAVLSPLPPQEQRQLQVGTGVRVEAVVQLIDTFLEDRLRVASSDLSAGEIQDKVYAQLEAVLSELSDHDLSTSISRFFNSVTDVLNHPEDLAIRNLVSLEGQELARGIREIDRRVTGLRDDLNQRVLKVSDDVNRLLEEIVDLNQRIVLAEKGGATPSDAGGLRDQRYQALAELGNLINVRVAEGQNGAVNVFVNGEFLVFENAVHHVEVGYDLDDRGLNTAFLRVAENNARLVSQTGEYGGLVRARDEVLAGFLDELDAFTQDLVFEFNKVHSAGQGLEGYSEFTSAFSVDDPALALDSAGLSYTPIGGSFQVQLYNTTNGLTESHEIFVRLNGLDDDTTLTSLTADLDGIDGLTASITPEGNLTLQSEDPLIEIAFAADTGGVLAALGFNHFFEGSRASEIQVADHIVGKPQLFAASRDGIGNDSANAELLAGLLHAPLEDGRTLQTSYEQIAGNVAQASSVSRAVTEGQRAFQRTLEGEKLAISGVNIDEEAINLITLQRVYQATAKYIGTISDLLDVLVNL